MIELTNHINRSIAVLQDILVNAELRMKTKVAIDIMSKALAQGNKIMCIGNGGSMCDAMHFASELTGKYRDVRRPLPAMAFSDAAANSCIANDFGYENIFKRQLIAYARPGDVLLALSTSGNSENILYAMLNCPQIAVKVVGITGIQYKPDHTFINACREFMDDGVCIEIPSKNTAIVQQATMTLLHAFVESIEHELQL